MNQKIRLNIGGMTCVNCQNKIEKTLNHTDGVKTAKVSYNNACADIEYDDKIISRDGIAAVIEKLDYKVISRRNSAPSLTNIISVLIIIVSLYVILQEL